MTDRRLFFTYCAAHFWVDLSCALLMFRSVADAPGAASCFFWYNFCAFALQMPFGIIVDRLDRNFSVAAAGCLLVGAAYAVPVGMACSVAAGTGNALFHLGGGVDVLNRSGDRMGKLGLFVSPGAVGLYIGTIWGKGIGPSAIFGPAGLGVLALAILVLGRRCSGAYGSGNADFDPEVRMPVRKLAALFLVVVLRSYMGTCQEFGWKGIGIWGTALVLALAGGKSAGGYLADRFGIVRTSVCSLVLAAGLYLASSMPVPGVLAVFLFNMTMPLTLWLAMKAVPGAKGFAFGLLTCALFVGYVPSGLGMPGLVSGPAGYCAVSLASLALLLTGVDEKCICC